MTEATFSQSRNDMYWKVWAGEDAFIRWTGYDDGFWWQNVAPTEAWRTKEGASTGRLFTLDPETGAVTIREPVSGEPS